MMNREELWIRDSRREIQNEEIMGREALVIGDDTLAYVIVV